MLGWRHSGFSVHHPVRLGEEDAEGRKKLAGYRLRAPMSLEKMRYDPATGTVIYRSKMHLGLIRKVYEADPLECPQCHGPMRVIALIDESRLSCGASSSTWGAGRPRPACGRQAMARSPPVPPEAWPANTVLPLTYHPVPDIA